MTGYPSAQLLRTSFPAISPVTAVKCTISRDIFISILWSGEVGNIINGKDKQFLASLVSLMCVIVPVPVWYWHMLALLYVSRPEEMSRIDPSFCSTLFVRGSLLFTAIVYITRLAALAFRGGLVCLHLLFPPGAGITCVSSSLNLSYGNRNLGLNTCEPSSLPTDPSS